MKHAVTRTLYDYWTRLRGRRTAPARHEVEPGDIREILGDTFILEVIDRSTFTFRLAGTRFCAAYCRELKGRNFLDLWAGKDREAVACLLAAVVEDGAAAVLGIDAQNERGQALPVEVMLLPLKHEGPQHTRVLGCFAPMDQPYWIGIHPVVRQPVHSLRLIWPDEKPSFLRSGDDLDDDMEIPPAIVVDDRRRSGPVPGRRVAHLRVIEGGRNG